MNLVNVVKEWTLMHLRFPIQWGGENCNRAKKNKFSLDKKEKKTMAPFLFNLQKNHYRQYMYSNFLTMGLIFWQWSYSSRTMSGPHYNADTIRPENFFSHYFSIHIISKKIKQLSKYIPTLDILEKYWKNYF